MTTSGQELSKTTNTGPMLTITSSTVDAVDPKNNQMASMTNAQQNAMSNMFKQFLK